MIFKGRTRCLTALGAALVLVLAGCASLRYRALLWTRKSGETLETHPEQVWTDLGCDGKSLPLIDIEHEELIPPQVPPGGRLNYRMVYAMCGGPHAGVVQATVTRRIYFKGALASRNERDDFEFKPGRWIVDAFFTVPEDAESGVYSLDVIYVSPSFRYDNTRTFVVDRE